jgi:hypothetical protein
LGGAVLSATAAPKTFTPAPVPDISLEDPVSPHAAAGPGFGITPNLVHRPVAAIQSDGYMPGSTMQYDPSRRLRSSPGVQLSLPLN